jgi:hypothetical protein
MSMAAERTEAIRTRHWKVGGPGTVSPEHCVMCGLAWPCDTAVALAEITRLRARIAELEAAMREARRWCMVGGAYAIDAVLPPEDQP